MPSSLRQRKEWKALENHCGKIGKIHLRDLFAEDGGRFDKFHIRQDGLLLDFSKQKITDETVALLCALAEACDVEDWRDRMFAGERINSSEDRAVRHWALREPKPETEVADTLARMEKLSQSVRKSAITDVVNIGIGGSDLGPHLVCEALRDYSDGPNIHFVSNIDGAHLSQTIKNLKPETTLFIIASKTFTTLETMTNAQSAKKWSGGKSGFYAVSNNVAAAKAFGIEEDHILPLPGWVGGRYSVWSAIGLPVCISVGFDNFKQFLAGAYAMDQHFRQAPFEKNMPTMLALLGVWQRNFMGLETLAVLPYSQNLEIFPCWLQQLDMESNGKNTDRNSQRVDYATSPVIFGQAGTNGQHAFYQMLHQGTDIVPCDFIVPVTIKNPLSDHHEKLLANALAQTQALMQGSEASEPWRQFDGDRPSNTILLDELDPYHLGMLLALYEHKIFVQGVIWNLNSFDQWGVELGKALAKNILLHMQGKGDSDLDASTQGLLKSLKPAKNS